MSLIIKGIKLPENDGMKELVIGRAPNGTEPIAIVSGDITEFHKVIEIPTPHGRLIDADTVEKRLQKYWYEEYPNQEASYHRAFMDSNACVKDLPTIIEAEVSE